MVKEMERGKLTQEWADEFMKVAAKRLPNGTPTQIKKLAKKLAKKQGFKL